MTKRRRDILKTCLGACAAGALAGCTGLFDMGGNGIFPIYLHNVTETDQVVSVTVTNNSDDSVTVEETYEPVPGESVVVGEKFKEVDKHTVEAEVESDDQGEFEFTRNAYEWNASATLYVLLEDVGPKFAKGVAPTSPGTP